MTHALSTTGCKSTLVLEHVCVALKAAAFKSFNLSHVP